MEWKHYRLDIDIGELPDQLAHDIDAIVDASQEYSLVPHYNAPLKQNLSCFSSDPCDLVWMVKMSMERNTLAHFPAFV